MFIIVFTGYVKIWKKKGIFWRLRTSKCIFFRYIFFFLYKTKIILFPMVISPRNYIVKSRKKTQYENDFIWSFSLLVFSNFSLCSIYSYTEKDSSARQLVKTKLTCNKMEILWNYFIANVSKVKDLIKRY